MQSSLQSPVIGIIGGSGLYEVDGLEHIQSVSVTTPFGAPSDAFLIGHMGHTKVVFLARHGAHHGLLPSEVPYKANIYALKTLGVTHIVSISAVGSLREYMCPQHLVIVSQYMDFTKNRSATFFGKGLVGHISMAHPTCAHLNAIIYDAACDTLGDDAYTIHKAGTYVCIEGPQFSSFAESIMYQKIGADLVGMTNMPEAKLAREAQMAYSSLTMVTDYDCWHTTHSTENVDNILQNLLATTQKVKKILPNIIHGIATHNPPSHAHTALSMAVLTPPQALSAENAHLLDVLRADTKGKPLT